MLTALWPPYATKTLEHFGISWVSRFVSFVTSWLLIFTLCFVASGGANRNCRHRTNIRTNRNILVPLTPGFFRPFVGFVCFRWTILFDLLIFARFKAAFSVCSVSDQFFICTVEQMRTLADLIDYIPLPLKVRLPFTAFECDLVYLFCLVFFQVRYTFCISPINVDSKLTAAAFVKMVRRWVVQMFSAITHICYIS